MRASRTVKLPASRKMTLRKTANPSAVIMPLKPVMCPALGQGNMPSYKTSIDSNTRWAVIRYLRAVQRAKNPTAEDLAEFGKLHTEGLFTPLRVGQDTVVFLAAAISWAKR